MTDEWPAWATERVELVDPSPDWAVRAAATVGDLRRRLGPWLAGPVEHIGSTSVPGLPAKPIVDLMAEIRALEDAPAIASALQPAGWVLVPAELDLRTTRRFLVQVADDRRRSHLHLVLPGSGELERHLAFRDRLRADPALAAEYARLKRGLADRFADDREAYSEAKTEFVRRVLA